MADLTDSREHRNNKNSDLGPIQTNFVRRQERQGAIPTSTKLFQGLGGIPVAIVDFGVRTFLLLYYNQVLGLSASQASLVLLIALIADAISDPVVGSFSDNLRHRLGRRHPLMYLAIIPLGLSIYLLFAPLAVGLENPLPWLLVFTISTRLSLTFFAVPWGAMLAEMTDDYQERSALVSYRFGVIWIFGVVFTFCTFALIFTSSQEYPLGQLNPNNYPDFALAIALAVSIGALACTHLTRSEIPYLKQPDETHRTFSLHALFEELQVTATNAQFRILFLAVLASSVVTGTSQALEIYMTTYFWGFGGEELRWMSLVVIGGLLAVATVLPLQNRFDKKYLLVASSAAIMVISAIPVSMRLFGIAPENGSGQLLAMIVCTSIVVFYFITIALIMFTSMLADTVDLQDAQTGLRQEGLFNSAITFSAKATSGAGLLIAGLLIDFVVLMPDPATKQPITDDMLLRLGVLEAYVVPVFNLIWLWLALKYSITREQHQQTLNLLRARDHQD